MGINRRNFLKTLGVVGATLTVGKGIAAPDKPNGEIEFRGILYDSTRCLNCHVCERLCAKIHGAPEPEKPKDGEIRQTNETYRTVVNAYNTSKGEVYAKKQCMHCNEPACAAACLTQAMHKTQEGPVVWRGDKCMGCRYCMVSCPFNVPKFEYHSSNPKIEKCDMCFDRIKEGQMPACAEQCPTEAIVFGTRRELITEARRRINDSPGSYYDHIYGEHEAGGTGYLYLSPVPFEELGFNTTLQKSSYPALTKGFLYAVPSIFVLWPALLLGLQQATKNNRHNEDDDE